ncbi:MAG: hypothetical protein V7641_5019 [Blastocatellia bacterium]
MASNIWERRKEPRVNVRFSALLHWLSEDGKEITEATFTTSISNSGASLLTNRKPPVGKRINVTLDIEGQRGSSAAEVKWAGAAPDGFEIGISFNG